MANILIVDEDKYIGLLFNEYLWNEGCKVFSVNSYQDALTEISKTDFDLIFTNIVLGVNTGMDILNYVKKMNLNCPVIMISDYLTIESAIFSLRFGAIDYVCKPVKRETLLRATRSALQHKALNTEKERYRQNFEAVLSNLKDAVIAVDRNLLILSVNQAAENICGFSSNAIGRTFDSVESKCQGRCLRALKEMIEKGQPVQIHRLECEHRDIERKTVDLSVFPLTDSRGLFSGGVMVVRDETRLAALEQDLKERREFHNIIGKSEEMQKIYDLIDALSDVETPVLITGENGTGKELVAEALHFRGERCQGPYIKVNCAALSGGVLESELFGHVKGAFVGAVKDKIGRFERAEGGTLFLDEIDNISPRMQLRLLRVLQRNEVERIGDSTPRKVNVRIVAATNQDLREKVSKGEFREDLYNFLKVVEIYLAPLRERRDDIPLLTDHFLKKFNKKFAKRVHSVSEDVERLFMDHPWPGNVRELAHAIEHAFILCREDTLKLRHLPARFRGLKASSETRESVSPRSGWVNNYDTVLQALRKTGGNKAKAARLLGMCERTFSRKVKEYSITENEIHATVHC